jgi:hypothetical protein
VDVVLSPRTEILLKEMITNKYWYLARDSKDPNHWRAFPVLRWRKNLHVGCRILHPECVLELVEVGFVEKYKKLKVYRLNQQGRHFFGHSLARRC